MKMNLLDWLKQHEGETMATFGNARLVKKLNGRFELRGGSPDDRRAAREWCSLFLHEAVIAPATARPQEQSSSISIRRQLAITGG